MFVIEYVAVKYFKELSDRVSIRQIEVTMAAQKDNRNYFLMPTSKKSNDDYFESVIQEMKEYSKRALLAQPNSHKVTFPIVFMLHLLTRFPPSVCQHGSISRLKYSRHVGKYLLHYYSEYYHPKDIPLLYAIICAFNADVLDCFGLEPLSMRDQCNRYSLLAVKYYRMHKQNKASNLISSLTKKLETSHFTMLPKWSLNIMATKHIGIAIEYAGGHRNINFSQSEIYDNSLFLMRQSFDSFIIGHQKYSIYDRDGDDGCHTGFRFVCEVVRMMLQFDLPQKSRNYQKRYKYLLKIAIKTLKRIYASGIKCNERFGVYHAYLGYYYALFCQKENHLKVARKYLMKGIKMVQSVDKYSQSLSEIYYFLIWVTCGLCNINECIKALKISMDFNEYYDDTPGIGRCKRELKNMEFFRKQCEDQPESAEIIGMLYWNGVLKTRKKVSAEINTSVFKGQFSVWTIYFREQEYYQTLRNIVVMKECNYSNCRAKNIKLQTCSKCKSVYYCSRAHQKLDWKMKQRFACKEYHKRNPDLTLRNTARRWDDGSMVGSQICYTDLLS